MKHLTFISLDFQQKGQYLFTSTENGILYFKGATLGCRTLVCDTTSEVRFLPSPYESQMDETFSSKVEFIWCFHLYYFITYLSQHLLHIYFVTENGIHILQRGNFEGFFLKIGLFLWLRRLTVTPFLPISIKQKPYQNELTQQHSYRCV